MSDQIVPITPAPNQTIKANLVVNGATLVLYLTIYFNEMGGLWYMDVADSNQNPLIVAVPMNTGDWPAANILKQYQYLNIGSCYLINNGSQNDSPNASELGITFLLLWSDNVS